MHAILEVWVAIGRVTESLDQRKMSSVHEIAIALGQTVCEVFPVAHCLTGCDTVSSFFS